MYINRCKDNAKFRLSKGNENIFSFLSVRKLIKSNKKPNFRASNVMNACIVSAES